MYGSLRQKWLSFLASRDSVLHTADENLSIDNNVGILTNLTNQLQQTFPTMDVYATYGNHDYYPNNQYPPHNNEIYNRTLEHWRNWINDSAQETNFLKGYNFLRCYLQCQQNSLKIFQESSLIV